MKPDDLWPEKRNKSCDGEDADGGEGEGTGECKRNAEQYGRSSALASLSPHFPV